jgi:hypothetical protein
LFRITARTVLELGAELISSDIIAFYELIKNGFDAEARLGVVPERRRGVDIRFDIVLPRHAYLRVQDRIAAATKSSSAPGASDKEAAAQLQALKTEILDAFLVTASQAARDAYPHGYCHSEDHPVVLARHSLQQTVAQPVERPARKGRRLDRGAGRG